jgi:hypothetical protein
MSRDVRMRNIPLPDPPRMSGLWNIHRSKILPKFVRMRTYIWKFRPKFVRTVHILMGGLSGVLIDLTNCKKRFKSDRKPCCAINLDRLCATKIGARWLFFQVGSPTWSSDFYPGQKHFQMRQAKSECMWTFLRWNIRLARNPLLLVSVVQLGLAR